MALQRCILTLLSALLSCGLVSDAADITGRVHVRSTTPSDASGSSVSLTEPPRVVLNGGEFQTYARKDGSFTFLSVPPGVYLMEIFQKDAAYSQYKINVPAGSESVDGSGIQVVEYKYPGAPKLQAKHPIEALPVAPAIYFDERPRFNIWSLLGNQMVIMMLVMGCMVFMVKNMDPEQMKEVEQQQRDMGMDMSDPMAALKNIFSGGDDARPAAAATTAGGSSGRTAQRRQVGQ